MKNPMKANLNPEYEIEAKAANRFHVLVIHTLKVPGQRRYVDAPDVIMMQTRQEFDQFEKHKPKTISYTELIHDPLIRPKVAPVVAHDDIAEGVKAEPVQDDMAQSQPRNKGGRPPKKK